MKPPMYKEDGKVWIRSLKVQGTVVHVEPAADGNHLYKVAYRANNPRLRYPEMVGDFFEDQLESVPE